MEIIQVNAFRKNHEGIAREIRSDVAVFTAFEKSGPSIDAPPVGKNYVGLWDTGATGTGITKRVIDDLGLIPTGKAWCSHAQGRELKNRYIVNLKLPNEVGVHMLPVIETDLDGGIDVLIGMDIITCGDFVITNAHGRTHFSFRTPPIGGVDLSLPPADGPNLKNVKPPIPPSKNGKCSCGSGKKYKACCGDKRH